jgi:hypothetical protein
VGINSNAFEISKIELWLSNFKFKHIRKASVGAFVMVTKNINMEKKVGEWGLATISSIGSMIATRLTLIRFICNTLEKY